MIPGGDIYVNLATVINTVDCIVCLQVDAIKTREAEKVVRQNQRSGDDDESDNNEDNEEEENNKET